MGNGPKSRKANSRSKNKGFRKYFLSTKHRTKDVDQIQDEMAKGGLKFDYDEDLPGGGQFYCNETGKHFVDAESLERHKKSKAFKKRVKQLREEQYTQASADLGAGKTKEVLPPAHAKDEGEA